jgi:hypothetical protein
MPRFLVYTIDENLDQEVWVELPAWVEMTGKATVTASPLVIALPEILPTDIVVATLQSDDTGGSLGGILTASAGTDQITITTVNAPTTGDAVVGYSITRLPS